MIYAIAVSLYCYATELEFDATPVMYRSLMTVEVFWLTFFAQPKGVDLR